MADKHVDEGKGLLKEAAGSLADDQGLKDEDRADQAQPTFKDKVEKVIDAFAARDKQ